MPETALIVDNDFFFVKFLGDLLKERGYDVAQAYNGKQGISALENRLPDYVFVSILMPRIDGNQFIHFIREKYPDAEFSIIGMSDAIIELWELEREVGADYYFQKKPMEKMPGYVDKFMELIEGAPFLSSADKDLLDLDKVFRRQATVDLLESLSFQQGLFESAGVGIIVIERDARIVLVNSLTLEILNQPVSNMLSQRITTVFPPTAQNKILAGLKAVAKDTELRRKAFSVVVNNALVQMTISLLKVNGEIEGWIMMLDNKDLLMEID
jgi:CheY-like chemotaxis protein